MNAKSFFLLSTLFICLFSYGQDIPYVTGYWDPEGLGNHRAVISVNKNVSAAKVTIPWRRLDNVDSKGVLLYNALTGKEVKNFYFAKKHQEEAELIFEPQWGIGEYYLYYMPGRNEGYWWIPTAKYLSANVSGNEIWRNNYKGSISQDAAIVSRFESQSEYNSFYPMEIPVTLQEKEVLSAKYPRYSYLVFPEDRNFPARMTEEIPYRWYKMGAFGTFNGRAMKDESYAWQLGIYAFKNELENVIVKFSDLKSNDGAILPASIMKCINMGGIDHLGREFTKNVTIPKGEVRSLWLLAMIPTTQKPGIYTGFVTVSASNSNSYEIKTTIEVIDQTAENHGYNVPQNQSRLEWLYSNRGIDEKLFGDYTPVILKNNNISILGRKLTFNNQGFPSQISSTFNANNTDTNGDKRDILSNDITLDVIKEANRISFKSSKPKITEQHEASVTWENTLHSPEIDLHIKAKIECDGYVNYWLTITSNTDNLLDDIKLNIPFDKKVAKYFMGMGRKGGYLPESHQWKWQQEYANNMVWIGDVNAGLQLKLKHLTTDWKLGSFEKTGPYRDWSNDGKGGCDMTSNSDEVILTAYTGEKTLKKGEKVILNFGLCITPFKTLTDDHWDYRYFHHPNIDDAIKKGAKIVNIHQSYPTNLYINYPFLDSEKQKEIISNLKKEGIITKLYYTLRELTTYICEFWPMRHLDDEIFTRNNQLLLSDTHVEKEADRVYESSGHMWMNEHLRANYDPAWHQPYNKDGVGWDMSIRTQGLSRWHNYYIESLYWLSTEIGTRGLYLDGIGYDREVMKRVRKTLDEVPGSLLDFHSGNAFAHEYGLNSPANHCMELFPYLNSLWLGEMYDYNAQPDYWLIEISGIPFGLYGEMLEHCGNPYRGMVYGMSSRIYGGCDPTNIWKLWDHFGMRGSEIMGYWDNENPVKTTNKEVLSTIYNKDDKTLIVLGNWTSHEQNTTIHIDWEKLGYNPSKIRIEIPEIEHLQEKSSIDNLNDILNIPASKGLIIIVYNE